MIHLGWINSTMSEINELTDDLYEALADGEDPSATCDKISKQLKYIKEIYGKEATKKSGGPETVSGGGKPEPDDQRHNP